MKKRNSGVLLHISSLPSPFGIGVLGKEAKDFSKKLSSMGFGLWQVLPLGRVDMHSSPYCSPSAFAGSPAYIDPRELLELGLISQTDIEEGNDESIFKANIFEEEKKRTLLLKKAFCALTPEWDETLLMFENQNPWVLSYAIFMMLKEKNGGKPWWEWEDEEKHFEKAKKAYSFSDSKVKYFIFEQFIFFEGWRKFKEFANSNGVQIMGDMPIYVAMDSVDVWSDPKEFQLDENLCPTAVAGVPPDYFSEDGQLWGNPLYDWERMEQNGFAWWKSRIAHSAKLFDKIRIDHFRALASYWAVPADAKTAKTGKWIEGPRMKFFGAIRKCREEAEIVAEDLGTFGEDIIKLLEQSECPSMRVIQFGFDPNGDSTHLPHNYPFSCVAYVGTHDNNTILGWLWNASEDERRFALRYCCFGGSNWGDGGAHSGSCRAVIEAVWRSSAKTAIVAIQDMLGYGEDARMNTPGKAQNNWSFRVSADELSKLDQNYFKEINHIYRRG